MNVMIVRAADKLTAAVKRRVSVAWLNQLIVSAYKLCGFAILTAILLGIVSYIASYVFFTVNSRWVMPTILSPADEKVISLQSRVAQETAFKEKLVAERRDAQGRLDHERRIVAMESAFQESFAAAMRQELGDRKAELKRLSRLVAAHTSARAEIQRSSEAYAGLSRERMEGLYDAHLINQDDLVSGSYQLAQIAHSTLSLDEKAVALNSQIEALSRRVGALDVAVSAPGIGAAPARPLTYDVLSLTRELEHSVVEVARAQESQKAIEANLAVIDGMIASHERTIRAMQGSPYLKAVDRDLTVAFVPYENIENVSNDSPVYHCELLFVWCRRAGKVVELIEGEVHASHPMKGNWVSRGQMVQLQIDDEQAAQAKVLLVGSVPLLL
ncbi:hypothetical protein SOCEGT47_042420 [Sorangium cellulosum]|uniref:Uncharacterized protein n=1 Tax=Sorangium cellulosum TaxID=56 RepID=A0A4V0NDS7_SORCE|nr:hypothetical protein [Sorangium cellulosum]AUX23712.1 hypothetical protein SOCEGT47_042420 [Sorangium cellulosum]